MSSIVRCTTPYSRIEEMLTSLKVMMLATCGA